MSIKIRSFNLLFSIVLIIGFIGVVQAQYDDIIYNEDEVPDYNLPDPLVLSNGKKVDSKRVWHEKRRTEIVNLFENQVYGEAPEEDVEVKYEVKSIAKDHFGGNATRKIVSVYIIHGDQIQEVTLMIYIPNHVEDPAPVFLGSNYLGNQSTTYDPTLPLPNGWVKSGEQYPTKDHRATEESRGAKDYRWPFKMIVARGYAIATVCYGDFAPDTPEEYKAGIYSLFSQEDNTSSEWGAIAIWAYGLQKMLDYFEKDNQIDHKRVAVFGQSRRGKAALWAGALDQRFAMVYSNCSGCGGAALSRRHFGETLKIINHQFPHWFCDRFKKYNDNESDLPVDQHMLLSLIAPRPLYVASATKDLWADPRGEFLSAKHAEPVYNLFDKEGLKVAEMPEPNQSVGARIGYHIREGGHDITPFDWHLVLNFADKHLKPKK